MTSLILYHKPSFAVLWLWFQGAMEGILSGAITGVTFALFAGQPLNIIGATGPMLVFETILYDFCK